MVWHFLCMILFILCCCSSTPWWSGCMWSSSPTANTMVWLFQCRGRSWAVMGTRPKCPLELQSWVTYLTFGWVPHSVTEQNSSWSILKKLNNYEAKAERSAASTDTRRFSRDPILVVKKGAIHDPLRCTQKCNGLHNFKPIPSF